MGNSRLGIALSGGGIRAAAFHLGVFKYLAEINELENITHISSVSGGSLFTGLVFHFSNYIWPSSDYFNSKTFPAIYKLLTTKSLQGHAIRNLLKPYNWMHIFSRANI